MATIWQANGLLSPRILPQALRSFASRSSRQRKATALTDADIEPPQGPRSKTPPLRQPSPTPTSIENVVVSSSSSTPGTRAEDQSEEEAGSTSGGRRSGSGGRGGRGGRRGQRGGRPSGQGSVREQKVGGRGSDDQKAHVKRVFRKAQASFKAGRVDQGIELLKSCLEVSLTPQ